MIEYLDRYAEMFNLRPRFGESVESVNPDGLGWRIESTSSVVHARHVVIATGLNSEASTPQLNGIESFYGQVLHSSAYVNSAPFRGQSVLVVGMGNTGAEIALDLCLGGASTTISVRSGVHVAPRDLFGLPIQLVAMGATKLLPDKVNDAVFPIVLDWALDYPARHGVRRPVEGILHQIASKGRIPVLDVGTIRKIAEGAITVLPEVLKVQGKQVIFREGETRQFDAVIFSTGYQPNYTKFLARELAATPSKALTERVPQRLHFVGFRSPVTGLLREISREAVQVAAEIRSLQASDRADRVS
jgi:cation diffusion facilitator CzcD-associated flavoprotein CzcO